MNDRKSKFAVISYVLGALILCATVWYVVAMNRNSAASLAAQQAEWDVQHAAMQAELDVIELALAARTEKPLTETDPALNPEVLIERLLALKEGPDNNTRHLGGNKDNYGWLANQRTVLFCCKGLTLSGDNSLPGIRKYLESGKDLELQSGHFMRIVETGYNNYAADLADTNQISVATVRLGLARVLHDIRSRDSVKLLNEMFLNGKDAMFDEGKDIPEMLVVGSLLLDIDREKFRKLFIDTIIARLNECHVHAGEDFTSTADDDFLGRRRRSTLLSFLYKLGGSEFAEIMAQQKIYREGRVDTTLIPFMVRALKGEAIPHIYEAFKGSGATADDHKKLLRSVINYIDNSNPQAVEMLTTVMSESDPKLASSQNSQVILSLAGKIQEMDYGIAMDQWSLYSTSQIYYTPLNSDATTDARLAHEQQYKQNDLSPTVAQSRLELMDVLAKRYESDPVVTDAITATRTALEYQADPAAYTSRPVVDKELLKGIDFNALNANDMGVIIGF